MRSGRLLQGVVGQGTRGGRTGWALGLDDSSFPLLLACGVLGWVGDGSCLPKTDERTNKDDDNTPSAVFHRLPTPVVTQSVSYRSFLQRGSLTYLDSVCP